MDNGGCINSIKLIEILGGPDAILQHYLSSNNPSPLTTQQLDQINDLLAPNKEHPDIPSPILFVSAENTFSNQIFGPKIGNKISNMILNRIPFSIIALLMLALFIIDLTHDTKKGASNHAHWLRVCHIIFYSIAFIFAVFLLLAMNKTTTKLVLQTFETWFRLLYFIKYAICVILYFGSSPVIIFFMIAVFMAVLVFCLWDGLQLPFKLKATVLIAISLLFSLNTFVWTFIWRESNFVTLNLWSNYSFRFDLRIWIADSIRIITIFAWKQTIYTMFKSPKSSVIMAPVKIIWK